MTVTAWRICKARHAATAFDGFGARQFGGRWNSRGVGVVYAASQASLAYLEMLVHADAVAMTLSWVLIPVVFDDALVTRVPPASLPANWKADQAVTRSVGDAWVRAGTSAVLRVPSVLIGTDDNFVFNPAHADFAKVRVRQEQALPIDERLKRLFTASE